MPIETFGHCAGGWARVVALSVLVSIGLASRLEAATDCTLFVRAGFVPVGGLGADGLTPDTAFAAIGPAASAINNPGAVVCVGPGRYVEGHIEPPVNGSAVAPIEFRADPSGSATGDPAGPVVVEPPTGLPPEQTPDAAFLLMARKHVVIDGFTIIGFDSAGIQVRSAATPDGGNSSEVVIRNNVIRSCGIGIDVSAEHRIVIEGNEVVDSRAAGIGVVACRGEALTSTQCRGGQSDKVRPQIANNRTAYNFSHGVFVQEATGGVVQNTVAFGNFSGITARAATNLLIANNLLYGNFQDGVALGADGAASPNPTVVNNTIYANGGWGVRIGDSTSASTNARVLQNILSQNDGGAVVVEQSSTCGYVAGFNLVDGPAPYGPKTPANVAYDLIGDPAFVDPAGPDGVLGWQVMNGALVDHSADDDFRLRRQGTGGPSPGIDAGFTPPAELGLQGSSIADEATDSGTADLGYHYGATPAQRITVTLPDAFMPLYVRIGGDDGADGKTPAGAMGTLARAAKVAKAGITVIAGPGTHVAANVGPDPNSGAVAFRADPSGRSTGDEAGPVLVDPSRLPTGSSKDTGFMLIENCGVTVQGFSIRFASDAGIQVRQGADGAVIRDNVVFSNSRGIDVMDADDVQIVNNLAYDNDTGGIQLGGLQVAARTRVQNNTVYGNVRGNGLTIGTGGGATPGTRVEFNIFAGNGLNGINAREPYSGRYNLFFANEAGHFGGAAARQDGDLVDVDPQFVDPPGADGRLGGNRFADDRFELQQQAAGEAATSRAVDAGPISAGEAGVASGTTRTDGAVDSGAVDLGFHYANRSAGDLYVDPNGDDDNSGRLPQLPLRTIAAALQHSAPGTRVHVAAGIFEEMNLRPGAGVTIIGAASGRSVISAGGGSTAFDVRHADVTLQRLDITGASETGVRLRADRAAVIDCWVYDNAEKGVGVPEGTGAFLFNNLIHDNGGTGIVVGSNAVAADAVTIANNTVVNNDGFGITVGLATTVAANRAVVVNNLLADNRSKGLAVDGASAATLQVGYNCNSDGYGGIELPPTDLIADPWLLAPEATPPDFRLYQEAAGEELTSACVDAGWRKAQQIGLDESTTRTDNRPDNGQVDAGYHYGLLTFDRDILPLLRLGGPHGDCDGDGATRVNEVILGVSIALDAAPVSACPVLDDRGDGRVTIDEVLAAVTALLGL